MTREEEDKIVIKIWEALGGPRKVKKEELYELIILYSKCVLVDPSQMNDVDRDRLIDFLSKKSWRAAWFLTVMGAILLPNHFAEIERTLKIHSAAKISNPENKVS